jgi:hypothetical protein
MKTYMEISHSRKLKNLPFFYLLRWGVKNSLLNLSDKKEVI